MARKPGARLTQRKAKREVAKATRDTKYANQKGGGSNSKRRIGRKRSDALLDLPEHLKQQQEEEEDDGEPEQVDDDKAIRAFTKKLRQIEELKARQKKGDALNDEQLAKIAGERAILKKIIELTAPVDGDDGEVAEAEAPPKGRSPKSAKRRRS